MDYDFAHCPSGRQKSQAKKRAMAVNSNKPEQWKQDIAASVDMYNAWFMHSAPAAFRQTREHTTKEVETMLVVTRNLTNVGVELLKKKPSVLSSLRMSTCPPLARDRLVGLAGVSKNLVRTMEKYDRLPLQMAQTNLDRDLKKIGQIIKQMFDPDLFVWLGRKTDPTEQELFRAATIVADRLCGAEANPIVRNAQEKRQLSAIDDWLSGKGYQYIHSKEVEQFCELVPGTYSFHLNVIVNQESSDKSVNMPIDAVVMPSIANKGELPLLIEAKSAGDFTNVNKRRKEEATKMNQLRQTYGDNIRFILFLCGYFDSGYLGGTSKNCRPSHGKACQPTRNPSTTDFLMMRRQSSGRLWPIFRDALGYEAAEGIDWVWEHRINDFKEFGL